MEEIIEFKPQVPLLNLQEDRDMLSDFSREAQRHLMSARNSLLILETVVSDKEAIESIFKTFHTIKGMADFLNLHDIFQLSKASEKLLDLIRKRAIGFDEKTGGLIQSAVFSLQELLELLDEQIFQNGELKSSYCDISPLMGAIQIVVQSVKKDSVKVPPAQRMPTIQFSADMNVYTKFETQLQAAGEEFLVKKELVKRLLSDFLVLSKELKELQSKLKERQRELIKERELALKLTQQAQNEARAKSEYLANMSHEIRTLINAMMGFTELLRDSPLNNKQKEHLNTVMISGKMLLGIVNDILDFSKVESGKLTFEKIDFDVRQSVVEVFQIIRPRLMGKPISLYFSIDAAIPRAVNGDPTRLKQILINLLDNAIKFTEDGSIGLVLTLAEQEKESLIPLNFKVSDTGIGIPEDRRTAIFESYTQADDSTTRLYGGTGLGLTLCKTFVEKMGGQISVHSEFGKGSQFEFTIEMPRAQHGLRIPDPLPPELADKSMVIVSRDEYVIAALQKICQDMKVIDVAVAASAKQTSELLLKMEAGKKSLPEMVFIDAMLPHKEGFMLSYKISQQERYQKIKRIAVAADVKLDNSLEFRDAGFHQLLAKPVIAKEVYDMVSLQTGKDSTSGRRVLREELDKISCDGIRILVVEDSPPNQELLKVHFESLGCVCDYANNGQEAIDKLKEKAFDICFMDLQMPVLGGVEATKFIRRELKIKIPIIALTAAEVEEEKQKCLDAGMNDYLPKPFDVDELKAKIIKCAKM